MSDRKPQAYIESESIYLRPLEPEDANGEYLAWVNNAELARFMSSMAVPSSKRRLEQYVASQLDDPSIVFFAVCEKDTDRHVGNIKLGPINWPSRKAEYGRLFGPAARGKGYGSEAVRLVLRYAFEVLGLNKVTAGCLAGNKAAIRSNEKGGLKVEAVLRQEEYADGRYQDGVRMGLTRDQYWSEVKGEPMPEERPGD